MSLNEENKTPLAIANYHRKNVYKMFFLSTLIVCAVVIYALINFRETILEVMPSPFPWDTVLLFSLVASTIITSYLTYRVMNNARLYLSLEKLSSPTGFFFFMFTSYPQNALPKFTLTPSEIYAATLTNTSPNTYDPDSVKLVLTGLHYQKYTVYPTHWRFEHEADIPKPATKQYSLEELNESVFQSPLMQYLVQHNILINNKIK